MLDVTEGIDNISCNVDILRSRWEGFKHGKKLHAPSPAGVGIQQTVLLLSEDDQEDEKHIRSDLQYPCFKKVKILLKEITSGFERVSCQMKPGLETQV